MPPILDSYSNMVTPSSSLLIARDGGNSSSTLTANGNIVTGDTDTLAQDLFQDKFMKIARGGSNGEKIIRGFLIGVALGLIVACFVCCWYPCCRSDRPRRRRGPRRPPVEEEEEETSNRTEQPAESTPATTPSPNTAPPA